ncbi:MAG: hypothetical protein FRX48_04886 [Lasallia pustulata]|uniref:Uncharacterized protein n=1 Tax=Lasallia pustulata TaxID=136370 RepID=A0A5M8PPV7_9LECA|nr:MAG: hypothetical protein FRX48_04886 [Lasallia pustulata]
MELDLRRLLETPDAERMKLLYSMLATVPPLLIFFHGRRIEEIGFRWAPQSFLGKGSRDHQNAVVGIPCTRDHEHGVKIVYPKLRLFARSEYLDSNITPLVSPTTKRIFFRDTFSNIWYMLTSFMVYTDPTDQMFNPLPSPGLHQRQPIVVLPH